jgi:hypothetical protein
VALEEIPLADAEVSGLVDIALDDAITLADGDADTVPARYATHTDTGLVYSEATLTTADLVPNYLKLDQLYLRLFIAAQRFCASARANARTCSGDSQKRSCANRCGRLYPTLSLSVTICSRPYTHSHATGARGSKP